MSLSHCSCYGPCEEAPIEFASLHELAAYSYDERAKEIAPLIDAINKAGADA